MRGPGRHVAGRIADWPKFACDAVLFVISFVVAIAAEAGRLPGPQDAASILAAMALLIPVKIGWLSYFGAYSGMWRYTSIDSLKELLYAAGAAIASIGALGSLTFASLVASPRALAIDATIGFLLVCGARLAVRLAHTTAASRRRAGARALIVGAGDAGEMVVREMRRGSRLHFDPVGFADDDPRKAGRRIHGIAVLGSRHDIPDLVERLRVETIVIAIPSASAAALADIVCQCRRSHADVRIFPDLGGLLDPSVGLSRLRPAEVLELLRRAPKAPHPQEVAPHLAGKCVLVTGAGGSIGSELSRQILRFGPSKLVMLGRGENSIHQAFQDLAPIAGSTRLVQVIGDVINKTKLAHVFETHKPDVVFHAAADKHVPLMELFPDEAVLNNVVGTRNVLELANASRSEKVVCISTDKAVRPTSIMGYTKRVAELLVGSPLYPNTQAVAVRFGNVFGSRGSVIPQFQAQIASGGPVTITDRGITRYFMTIPEAVELVLLAGAMGAARDVFVLDMGQPVRVWDLAAKMARLQGFEPDVDIEFKETGLRAGEKLHEELFLPSEQREATAHPRITRVRQDGSEPTRLSARIETLHQLALCMDFDGIRLELKRLVAEVDSTWAANDRPVPAQADRDRSWVRAVPRRSAIPAVGPV